MIYKSVDIKKIECIKGGVHGDSFINEFCSRGVICGHEMNSTKNCFQMNNSKTGVTIIFSVEFYLPETSVLIRLGSDI